MQPHLYITNLSKNHDKFYRNEKAIFIKRGLRNKKKLQKVADSFKLQKYRLINLFAHSLRTLSDDIARHPQSMEGGLVLQELCSVRHISPVKIGMVEK
ncbi:hypothetical protein CEXT_82621 [Caerostris extrusa]|uniref:Uncharacterized protein n=1 Tax=Caerostris extrusa TaxID=172846 RepID=A0AAV4M353_CAEEX|nr:hypothetical protein CEXT_82621 [Caerostris extrusa]